MTLLSNMRNGDHRIVGAIVAIAHDATHCHALISARCTRQTALGTGCVPAIDRGCGVRANATSRVTKNALLTKLPLRNTAKADGRDELASMAIWSHPFTGVDTTSRTLT
jgi:hypothetical protein